jgi:tetratricopeptide (TPR) repeat protein
VPHGYSLRDVERLLGLPRSVVSGLIEAGFVAPTRGARREYRFSFQDLVVLRTAQALSAAKIPHARILRSLRRLRAQLPREAPLAGLRIEAVGDAVVVSEGATQWRSDDGQYLLQFHVASRDGALAFISPVPADDARAERVSRSAGGTASAAEWFDHAISLESAQPQAACDAYLRALDLDPKLRDAYVNLGRLLHERGQLRRAEAVYRDGVARCGADATLLYNLGVLLEDLGDAQGAAASYRAALDAAPDLADAHYNLARLCASSGLQQEALRHWSAFRKLTGRR